MTVSQIIITFIIYTCAFLLLKWNGEKRPIDAPILILSVYFLWILLLGSEISHQLRN